MKTEQRLPGETDGFIDANVTFGKAGGFGPDSSSEGDSQRSAHRDDAHEHTQAVRAFRELPRLLSQNYPLQLKVKV
ncbi:hypothetical protein P0D88_19255 [Paraburkholderia sp. RL18-103-BIB-C]|uniref:hypothetical protein n=1 Tax=unclassified Paraburkholderia TaxID=2615204 RepID=UPI0038BC9019